ncbi:MAG: TetR/AcrR family transcriptional regulator [Pseudomonadota bacterium]
MKPHAVLPKLNRLDYTSAAQREATLDGTAQAVKRGRKFDQVLAGARKVFLAEGFEGASVDLIAKEACVSKATLYSYFPDKRVLFIEVTNAECAKQSERAIEFDGEVLPARQMLEKVARSMMVFLSSDFAHRIFRICVAESDRFPELGREFYMSGPRLMVERLGEYFQFACDRGELEIDDINLAAHQFHELMKADLFMKMVFNVIEKPDPAEIDRVVQGALDTFMARYGAKPK